MEIREADVLEMPNNTEFTCIHKNVDFTYIKANENITDLVPIIEFIPLKRKISLKVQNCIKRLFDIFGGIIGAAFILPFAIIIGIANLITGDKGPVFYAHKRIGKDGNYFKMYKFRSMCMNADERLKEILENDEAKRKEWEENQKLEDDPRITKLGRFLRKTSLDEFPQFLNVLKGDMSIIGPRAVVDDEIDKFGLKKYKVLSVKPGITGYWAANGRSNTTYDERVKMEATYVDEFSILLDLKILFKTVASVLKKEGAV